MSPARSNTSLVIHLVQVLVIGFISILSPLAMADWQFHNYSPLATSNATSYMGRAEISIKSKDSALTFSIQENVKNGEIKWLGMFTSPQTMKSLNSIESTNINPFDSSQVIVLKPPTRDLV